MKRYNTFDLKLGARFQSRENLVIILYEPPFSEGEHEANAASSPPWESLGKPAGMKDETTERSNVE